MTPEEFASKMESIYERFNDDPELGHATMDACMTELLRELGYGDGIDIFNKQSKWYA